MAWLMRLIRSFVGGKTEIGILISVLALVSYGFGWFKWLDEPSELTNFFTIVGSITGVALLSRIEDKEGFLKAFKTLFGPWRKKSP